MAKETVAILGGKGMLGTDLANTCRQHGFDVEIFDLPEFDITKPKQLESVVASTSIIVNCAAYTNVDGAEGERELAHRVNGEMVGKLGTIANKTGTWVLHISTDFVFDGKMDRPYVETDTPNPLSEYGKSKLIGERLLIASGCTNCIMRIEWTYGLHGNNFIIKLIERAKAGKALRVVDDQIGSPTATTEAAKVICELLQRRPQGILHFAAAGYVSRYEMAKFVFDKLSINVSLLPCRTTDYVTPAMRPLNSRFDCSKIGRLLAEPIKSWQEPLEYFLRKL